MTWNPRMIVLLAFAGCATAPARQTALPAPGLPAAAVMPLSPRVTLAGGVTPVDLRIVQQQLGLQAQWADGHCGYGCPIDHVVKFVEPAGARLVATVGSCCFEFTPDPVLGWRLVNQGVTILDLRTRP